MAAAAAAKSLQWCLTLCKPIDGSPPGSSISGMTAGQLKCLKAGDTNRLHLLCYLEWLGSNCAQYQGEQDSSLGWEGKNLLRAPCSLGRKIYLVLCWKQVLSCIGGLLVNFWACLLDLLFPLCLFSLLNSVSSWTLPFKFVIPTIPTMFFFSFPGCP